MMKPREISAILVGTSAGGVTAIQVLLQSLPTNFRLPIIFVQHLPTDSNIDPALIYSRYYNGEILEALDKMPAETRHIYFAPPNYHLSLEKDLTFSLSQDDPVHFARPSIDVLFESAAINIGPRACGVLLTGANDDGASGLKAIASCGGSTFVQDPAQAEAPTMPKAALQVMKPDFVGSLPAIAEALVKMTGGDVQ